MNAFKDSKLSTFLSFNVQDELFAINVSSVLTILNYTKITKIPKAPDYIIGMINYRGVVLPIIDLHIKLDIGVTEIKSNTCILAVEIINEDEQFRFGILVDNVNEVYELASDEIMPTPNIGKNFRLEIIDGIYKTGELFIMLLDIEKIFVLDDIKVVNRPIESKISLT